MNTLNTLMRCRQSINVLFATSKAVIHRRASIDYVGKTFLSRTPGEVTKEVGHN